MRRSGAILVAAVLLAGAIVTFSNSSDRDGEERAFVPKPRPPTSGPPPAQVTEVRSRDPLHPDEARDALTCERRGSAGQLELRPDATGLPKSVAAATARMLHSFDIAVPKPKYDIRVSEPQIVVANRPLVPAAIAVVSANDVPAVSMYFTGMPDGGFGLMQMYVCEGLVQRT